MTREHWRKKLRRQPHQGGESLRIVTQWTRWESNGEYRRCRSRCRAVAALAGFLSHLSGKRRSKCARHPEARRRRYSPFRPAHRRACLLKGGLSTAILPPPQLCTPMFARHSRRFAAQNRAPGRFEGPKSWRFAREGLFRNRYTPTGPLLNRPIPHFPLYH